MIFTLSPQEYRLTLKAILAAWGTREGRGRLAHETSGEASIDRRALFIGAAIRNLDSPDAAVREAAAVEIVLHSRTLLLGDILKADPTGECLETLIDASDSAALYNYRRRPFVAWTRNLPDHDQRFIQSLTRADVEAGGPLAAIATSSSGPFALMDGNHRAAAWTAHQQAGDLYPLRLGVIIVRQLRLHLSSDAGTPG